MSVNHAILGLLSAKPMSGYDIKKVMQDSLHMYWSGNNNQIYKALLQLCSDGYLAGETLNQDNGPSKKIYQITDQGRSALAQWASTSSPEAPEFKKPFLIQLSCAGQLDIEQLEALILQYQESLEMQLLMQQEKQRRQPVNPDHKGREAFIEAMIFDNIVAFYRAELEWTGRLLEGIRPGKERDE